jgi:homoserine O-acetyltransferase
MVSVIGMAQADAWSVAALEQWATPIKADPKWQRGQYPLDVQPRDGMINALSVITQSALHPRSFNQLFANHQSLDKEALMSITAEFPVTQALKARARLRSTSMDANHLLYLIRACQLFVTGHNSNLIEGLASIKAKSLFLPASGDVLLMPYMAKHAHEQLREQGNASQYYEIPGDYGHLDGIYNIQFHQDVLRGFLASDVN